VLPDLQFNLKIENQKFQTLPPIPPKHGIRTPHSTIPKHFRMPIAISISIGVPIPVPINPQHRPLGPRHPPILFPPRKAAAARE
jgi:hypothetical protein